MYEAKKGEYLFWYRMSVERNEPVSCQILLLLLLLSLLSTFFSTFLLFLKRWEKQSGLLFPLYTPHPGAGFRIPFRQCKSHQIAFVSKTFRSIPIIMYNVTKQRKVHTKRSITAQKSCSDVKTICIYIVHRINVSQHRKVNTILISALSW